MGTLQQDVGPRDRWLFRSVFQWRALARACGPRNICDNFYRSPQDRTIFKNYIYKPSTTEPYDDRTATAWYVTEALLRAATVVPLLSHQKSDQYVHWSP